MINNNLIEILRSIPWFLGLNPKQLERLASISTVVQYQPGNVIFSEGDRTINMYIILAGEVGIDVSIPTRGLVRTYVAEPLDIIGWSKMTPVVRQRVASTIALSDVTLLEIKGDQLLALCDEDHLVGYVVFRRIANVVATNLLTTKLQLMEMILQPSQELPPKTKV
jgi:CRP/FNR family cyclic AMP-dependent transcriptional regulator